MSADGVPIQEISDTVGHKSTHVTETVYRHVIVPATRGARHGRMSLPWWWVVIRTAR
jgi:hypothetical protein